MNSCLSDISRYIVEVSFLHINLPESFRYGVYSMRSYKQNLDYNMDSFQQMLPKTLFLWLSALPVSNSCNG